LKVRVRALRREWILGDPAADPLSPGGCNDIERQVVEGPISAILGKDFKSIFMGLRGAGWKHYAYAIKV